MVFKTISGRVFVGKFAHNLAMTHGLRKWTLLQHGKGSALAVLPSAPICANPRGHQVWCPYRSVVASKRKVHMVAQAKSGCNRAQTSPCIC
ncbi:MAG: hypothetical protein RSE27_08180, partial [Ruthenibacterium sp.]